MKRSIQEFKRTVQEWLLDLQFYYPPGVRFTDRPTCPTRGLRPIRRLRAAYHFDRAGRLMDQDRYHAAIDHLSQALDIAPGYGAALLFCAQCHSHLGAYPSAIADFTALIKLRAQDDSISFLYCERAAAHCRHGNLEAALADIAAARACPDLAGDSLSHVEYHWRRTIGDTSAPSPA